MSADTLLPAPGTAPASPPATVDRTGATAAGARSAGVPAGAATTDHLAARVATDATVDLSAAVAAVPPSVPSDGLAALRERMRDCCENAVDSLEVAARLEAAGVNDAVATEYGYPDVFTLAARLYAETPRSPAGAPPSGAVWECRATQHLLRGALFGLPGLLYVAASRQPLAPRATAVVVLSLLVGWAASEALSYLGYLRLGQGRPDAAARMLRRGALVALAILLPALCGVALELHIGVRAASFAAGQVVYLVAATVVLVTGGERWLLAALGPGVAASTLFLAGDYAARGLLELGALIAAPVGAAPAASGLLSFASTIVTPTGPPASTRPYVWACAGVTVLATVLIAAIRTRRSGSATGPTVSAGDLLRAAPHAAFGVLAGGLLTFGTLVAIAGQDPQHRASAVMALPLSISMGAAEWLLFRYRRRAHQLLQSRTGLRAFGRGVRGVLWAAVATYLTVLMYLADAVAFLGHVSGSFELTRPTFWTVVMLGGALLTALALRSCGITGPVLFAFAWTLIAEAALVLGAPRLGLPIPPDTAQLVACSVLFGGLLAAASVTLSRATRHR